MDVPADWTKDFFGGLAADFWHAAMPAAATEAEIALALKLLGASPGASLLDVPCGNGRHTKLAALKGYRMTAVDGSSALLAYARERTVAAGATAVAGGSAWLHERDMRDLPWQAAFDGAWCLGNSFGYLGDGPRGDAAFLAAVQAALRPGARFVLEAATLETLLPHLAQRRWLEAGGILFCAAMTYDPADGVIRSDYLFQKGAVAERKSAYIRVRSVHETMGLLEAAGFDDVAVHDATGEPFAMGKDRTYFSAAARR